MRSISVFLKFIIITVILIQSDISFSAVKFYQSSKVHSNGSISITFTYSAKESDLKDNKIGDLPFAINDVRQFFYSPDSEIKKSLAYKDPSDNSISAVTVDLEVRDLNKFSELKGFNSFKAHWMNSDTGMVFNWLVPEAFIKSNLIDTYQFILAFEDKIKSTNGVMKNNTCDWYVFADKVNPGGAYFVATVTPSEDSKTTQSSETSEEKKPDNNVKSGGKEKSDDGVKQNEKSKTCGVFSVELPVILFTGLIISYSRRKRRLKK